MKLKEKRFPLCTNQSKTTSKKQLEKVSKVAKLFLFSIQFRLFRRQPKYSKKTNTKEKENHQQIDKCKSQGAEKIYKKEEYKRPIDSFYNEERTKKERPRKKLGKKKFFLHRFQRGS